MFRIIDIQNDLKPVKSRFQSASKAYDWAKKHLGKDSCHPWGMGKVGKSHRYFIQSY